MEFHGLSRKELQALCKRNKIPANMTNVAMADALAALPQVEGLGEIVNPREGGDIGTPAVQPRTAGRTTTQRKAVKEPESSKVVPTRVSRGARSGVVEKEVEEENRDVNVPLTPAVVPSSRRRAPAVSTRRQKEVIVLDDEDDDKNEVDEKPKDVVAKTSAVVPGSRTRAAGRSVRGKNEVSDGASLQNAYSTRRSVRVLGKSLSKISLVETEGMEQTKIDDVSEEGTSLQTESNEVSQNNDEVDVSSVNKADSETQSHDSGSEAKSADAEDVLQAEPEVEGSENVNQVEAAHEDPSLNLHDSFETCVDSNEAESEQPEQEESEQPEPEESGGSAAPEDAPLEVAAPEDTPLQVAAPEEAPLEVAGQPIATSTDGVSGGISTEVAGQEDVAGLSVAAPEEDPEVVEQPITASTEVVSGDISMEVDDQEDAAGLSVAAPEEAPLEVVEQPITASTEVADQEDVAGLSVEASEEAFKGAAEQAVVGLSVEASEEASKEVSHQVIAPSTDVVSDGADQEDVAGLSAEASEEAIKETAELAIVGLSVESSEEASKEVVVPDDACVNKLDEGVADMVFEEVEKIEGVACVNKLDEGVADMVFEEVEKIEGAVSAILAEKNEASGRAENEVRIQSFEGEKESNDIEKVIFKLSMLDVAVNPELEGVAQINHRRTNDSAVGSVFQQIYEDPICSAQSETKGNLKTIDVQDMSMRSLKKLLKSGTKDIANEIQAVTSVESGMTNPNVTKENPKNINVQNMSMRGLKKLLKEKLDGKLVMTDNNDDVPMQGVEKKRTALQALPQNQLAE